MHIYERSISICMWFVRRWCVKLKFNIFYFMVEMVIQQVQFFDNEFIANEDTSVDEECANQGWFNATEEERQTRIKHHNSIWGPFGRNLHEDLLGVAGQGTTMREGTEPRNILHGRHENSTIHDEVGMRHYYAEWSKWMQVDASNPALAA